LVDFSCSSKVYIYSLNMLVVLSKALC